MPCFEESKIRTAPALGAVIVGEEVWEQASFYIGKYSSSFYKCCLGTSAYRLGRMKPSLMSLCYFISIN